MGDLVLVFIGLLLVDGSNYFQLPIANHVKFHAVSLTLPPCAIYLVKTENEEPDLE